MIFEALKYRIDKDLREGGEIQLTSAQEQVLRSEGVYYAFEAEGERYDMGVPAEYVKALWSLAGFGSA